MLKVESFLIHSLFHHDTSSDSASSLENDVREPVSTLLTPILVISMWIRCTFAILYLLTVIHTSAIMFFGNKIRNLLENKVAKYFFVRVTTTRTNCSLVIDQSTNVSCDNNVCRPLYVNLILTKNTGDSGRSKIFVKI